MTKKLKSCAIGIIMIAILGGAYKYDFRNASIAKTQPIALIHKRNYLKTQNKLIKKAIDKIGFTDSGDAKVEYSKHSQTLRFVLLDMDAYSKFEHGLQHKQTRRFEKITHMSSVNSVVIISHHARIRKMIQLHEEAQQRHLDQIRIHRIKARQQRKARDAKMAKLVKQLNQKKRHKQASHKKPNNHKKGNSHKSSHKH